MLNLTEATQQSARKPTLTPNMVLEIQGYDRLFSISGVDSLIRIGDEGLFIGDDWVIGGTRERLDTDKYITLDGSTTSIGQQLNQDKGGASSVSSVQISLIDPNEEVTRLISPSVEIDEIMGRRAWVYLGFNDPDSEIKFPEDYPILFSGIIDDVTLGATITITVSHPEQKKRQDIFPVIETEIVGAITNSQTTIPVKTVKDLLNQSLPELTTYIKIEDEIIQYTGTNSITNELTGCVRARFGTIADSHSDASSVSTFYRLQDDAINLSLKLMLSGGEEYYYQDIKALAFGQDFDGNLVSNAILFSGINVKEKYGFAIGDLLTSTGATNGANNFSLKQISSITTSVDGSLVVVSGVSLVLEVGTAASIKIKSQYNVLPDGIGLGGDQVEVEEFKRIETLYSGQILDYDFYITDTIQAKDFIDKEILYPANLYSLPKKGKVSLGAVAPPLGVSSLVILNSDAIIEPSKIKIRRSLGKYFYNTVIFKYDFDAIETDKPLAGYITVDENSKNRIDAGTRAYKVNAKGLRRTSDTDNILDINSRRILDRYSLAAEFITCDVSYGKGFAIDAGDVVLFGSRDMPLVDSKNGVRGFSPRLCEVVDRKLDIKSGRISLTLVDTNYLVSGRYGIISPATVIGTGSTVSSLVMTDSFGTASPAVEKDKWVDYIGLKIYIHNEDYSIEYNSEIIGFDISDPYKMLITPVAAPPTAGMIIRIPDYPDSTDSEESFLYKNVFVFTNPTVLVDVGIDSLSFDVDAADTDKFLVGATIEIHNSSYTYRSGELKISEISGNTITVSSDIGFTPISGDLVDFIGYVDGGDSFRYI